VCHGVPERAKVSAASVTASIQDAAIAKAIDVFGIADPERQRRVIVRPIAEW